jgi:hypothetical protein
MLVPVTLLHPAFAQFVDDWEIYEPTPQDYDFVSKFRVALALINQDVR